VNLNDMSTQLLFTTVPIWVEKAAGQTTSGTAFVYNFPVAGQEGQFIPLLITNYHVVAGAKRALIELVERDGEKPKETRIRAEMGGDLVLKFVDSKLDLAAVPLGPLLNQLESSQKPVFFRSFGPELIPTPEALNDLAAMEEVVFIGYPSGLRDQKSGMPIIRRGITASPLWNDFDNTPSFLVDAGVFPGSSGSPVFILNQGSYATRNGVAIGSRLLFLGVITESMLRLEGDGKAYLGLGKAVKSTALKSFVEKVISQMQPPGGLTGR
jgi:hypothetical protein